MLGTQTLNRQWSTDYFMHTATIDALRDDVLDPRHDMTGTDDPSERFSPYTVALAAVGEATGVSTVTILRVAGIANLVGFLAAFELLVRELTRRRRAAFFALLATLVMWGIGPWRWSGFLNLNSIGFGLPWPSMFATSVVLAVAWAVLRYDTTGARRWLPIIGGGVALAALSHPFTLMWGVVMLAALAVHRRLYRRGRVEGLLLATIGAVGLLAAWPYYPFFRLTSLDGAYSKIMQAMYTSVPTRTVAALPGIVVVLLRLRRDRRDPLGLMLGGGLALYLLGALADTPSLGRMLPLIMLASHIGLGVFLADLVARRHRASPATLACLGLAALIGIVGVAPALPRMVPRALLPGSLRERSALQPSGAPYASLAGALPSGSVIVAPTKLAAVATAYRYDVVAPGYPSAFVADIDARRRDASAFLDPTTPDDERATITERYGVDAVLCGSDACRRAFTDGAVVRHGPGWTLIRLVPTG